MTSPEDLDGLLASSSGFPGCPRCMYFQGGSAALCYRCASKRWQDLADSGHRCEVCDLPFPVGESSCHNPVCAMSDRCFEWNYAIAMRTGSLKATINAYKYRGRKAWATVFGRLVVGFLDTHEETFGPIDLIIPSPSFTGEGAHRPWDHVGEIVRAAARESASWPFDEASPPAIVKTMETAQMVGMPYRQRRAHAETALRAALAIPEPDRVMGKRILVVDDVFTDGLTLREVARSLQIDGGAAEVCGVTLVRQPFGGQSQSSA